MEKEVRRPAPHKHKFQPFSGPPPCPKVKLLMSYFITNYKPLGTNRTEVIFICTMYENGFRTVRKLIRTVRKWFRTVRNTKITKV